MILSAAATPAAAVSFASYQAGEGGGLVKSATAKSEPGKERFSTYRFEGKIFAWEGGKFTLRLFEAPTLQLDPATVRVSVKDWDVELNVGDAAWLPKHLVRRFLDLWSKAQSDTLNDGETESWAKIVGLVDMKMFAFEQSLPRYVEGQLLSANEPMRVKWHDGTIARVPRQFSDAFGILEEGEHFSAYVKFHPEGYPVVIERVLPLTLGATA